MSPQIDFESLTEEELAMALWGMASTFTYPGDPTTEEQRFEAYHKAIERLEIPSGSIESLRPEEEGDHG